jgi:hypothetical protein
MTVRDCGNERAVRTVAATVLLVKFVWLAFVVMTGSTLHAIPG